MAVEHLRDEDIAAGIVAAAAAEVIDMGAFPVRSSRTIAALAAALAAAQGKIVGAEKDRENPHLKSKYATLAAVWEACRAPLSENGLAVLQPATTEGNRVTVTTILTHKSGEWIAETLALTAAQTTPQAVGTAITYARRYSLSAMVGIAPDDDDDGNLASGSENGAHPQAPREQRKPPTATPRKSETQATALPETAPSGAPAHVGVLVDVKEMPSGAFALKLNTGFRCATRDKAMADGARKLMADGTIVDLTCKPPRDPQYAPTLEEITPVPLVTA